MMPEGKGMRRRTFLEHLMRGGVVLAGLSALAAAIAYFRSSSTMRRRYERLIRIGDAEHFPPGYSRLIRIQSDTILVGKDMKGRFFALSAICTHKGCLVEWKKGEGRLLCPCHAALFDLKGNVLSGPAQRSLRSYSVDLMGDSIYLRV